jgi:hypothetical protein
MRVLVNRVKKQAKACRFVSQLSNFANDRSYSCLHSVSQKRKKFDRDLSEL